MSPVQLRPLVSEAAFKKLNATATEFGVEPSVVAAHIIEQACKPADPTKTTRRYKRITAVELRLIAEYDELGYSKSEIARRLGCSYVTVHNHYRRALESRSR